MRGTSAVLIALALLAVPLGLAATAGATTDASGRVLTTAFFGPVPTDRFGGGMMVGVKAGQTNFGVFYGTSVHPNNLVIFAEYTRVLGGAQVVDEQGQYLSTRGIPVNTILAQSLNRFIEFTTVNVSAGFDVGINASAFGGGFGLGGNGSFGLLVNKPVKAINLDTAAWVLTGESMTVSGNTTFVNLTVAASNVAYTWVNPAFSATVGDGVLNEVAFTFHLVVNVKTLTLELPWYKVTVSNDVSREITKVDFTGNRTITGPAVVMDAKYDHLIQGWDFASPSSRLALETHLIFGNFYPDVTVDFVHKAYYHDAAGDGSGALVANSMTTADPTPPAPHLYTRDQIVFTDSWTRVGRFTWTSNVTVDGQAKTMLFQVQGGGHLLYGHDGAVFSGFWIRGAFVYPEGSTIVHDPAMSAEAFVPTVASGFNLTPLGLLLIQVAVIGVAIIPALYLRNKARRSAK
jgi:hypothetical protein